MFLCFVGSKVIAYVDKQLLPAASIRHVDCEVLLPAETQQQKCCKACKRYRNTLRSHRNDRYLSTPKQKAKVKMQRVALKEEQRRVRS